MSHHFFRLLGSATFFFLLLILTLPPHLIKRILSSGFTHCYQMEPNGYEWNGCKTTIFRWKIKADRPTLRRVVSLCCSFVFLFCHIIFILPSESLCWCFSISILALIMRSEFKQSFCTRLSNQRYGFTSLMSASTFQPKMCLMVPFSFALHPISYPFRLLPCLVPISLVTWKTNFFFFFFVIIKCVPLVPLNCCNTSCVQMANANWELLTCHETMKMMKYSSWNAISGTQNRNFELQ